jgi:pyrroline-5-carboxylate reductase
VKLGLIGAGNMASALARGIGEPVLVYDLDAPKAEQLAAELGGEAVESAPALAKRADVVVLCHKPQQLNEVAEQISARAIASILAATTTAQLEAAYHDTPVYRLASQGPENEILELFGRAGTIIGLDEEPLIEPAMALMSCGPAFLALVAESFADAGTRHGLPRDDAMRMVVEAMGGTAAYLAESAYDTGALKTRVATPGGATERGLIRLEEEGIGNVCRAAVDAVVEGTRR